MTKISAKQKRRITVWVLCLLSTTLLPLFIGKLFIPLEWYSFRMWEMMLDHRPACFNSGPFYPNLRMQRTQIGDLGVRSRFSIPKSIEWHTDEKGFRNMPQAFQDGVDVVIVGHSEAAGSSLSQDEMLAAHLMAQSDLRVYTYAPSNLRPFLHDPHFIKNPPKAVVVLSKERLLYNLQALTESNDSKRPDPFITGNLSEAYCEAISDDASIAVDRILKKPWINLHLYRLAIRQRPFPVIADPASGMLFFERSLKRIRQYGQDPNEHVSRAVSVIERWKQLLSERDIRFVFAAIPDKETIYWDRIPEALRAGIRMPDYAKRLSAALKDRRVHTVDITTEYQKSRRRGLSMYHLDDVHWNTQGSAIAAALIDRELKKMGID